MRSFGASIFCCQESKLAALDRQLVVQSCGSLLDNFEFIPSDGSRGGLFISWRADRFAVSCLHKGTWSLTLSVTNLEGGAVWTLTNVYGPQAPEQKVQFLNELTTVGQHHVQGAWCIVGDFNLLAAESDKNNQNVDRRMINRFRCFAEPAGAQGALSVRPSLHLEQRTRVTDSYQDRQSPGECGVGGLFPGCAPASSQLVGFGSLSSSFGL